MIGWQKGPPLCAELPNHGETREIHPSSIQSFLFVNREKRSNNAQKLPLFHHTFGRKGASLRFIIVIIPRVEPRASLSDTRRHCTGHGVDGRGSEVYPEGYSRVVYPGMYTSLYAQVVYPGMYTSLYPGGIPRDVHLSHLGYTGLYLSHLGYTGLYLTYLRVYMPTYVPQGVYAHLRTSGCTIPPGILRVYHTSRDTSVCTTPSCCPVCTTPSCCPMCTSVYPWCTRLGIHLPVSLLGKLSYVNGFSLSVQKEGIRRL